MTRHVLSVLFSLAWQLQIARAAMSFDGVPLCQPEESKEASMLRVMDETEGPIAKLGCQQVARVQSSIVSMAAAIV